VKGRDVVFSRGKDDWETPRALFDALHAEFDFTADVAASATNHLCPRWLGPGSEIAEDALACVWVKERAFCNPPYSQVKNFVARAAWAAANNGTTTVMLLPARTDTKWFHEFIWDRERHHPRKGVQVRFLKGRLKFLDGGVEKDAAPFPSMIVVFRGEE